MFEEQQKDTTEETKRKKQKNYMFQFSNANVLFVPQRLLVRRWVELLADANALEGFLAKMTSRFLCSPRQKRMKIEASSTIQ